MHRKGLLKSQRLICLVTKASETQYGLLPEDILAAIHMFDQLIKWRRAPGGGNFDIPEPQPGTDDRFNLAKREMDTYLESVVKRFKDRRIEETLGLHHKARQAVNLLSDSLSQVFRVLY